MSSCLFILDELLEPLISKNTKPVRNLPDIIKSFKESWTPTSPPIITVSNWHYVYVKRDALWFVAAIHYMDEKCMNLMMILFYLDQLYYLLKNYFKKELLTKLLIIDNALLVTELMDESIDFGIIQMTDPSIIRDYIRVKINNSIATGNNSNDDSDDSDTESASSKKNAKSLGSYMPSANNLTNLWKGYSTKDETLNENVNNDNFENNDDETYINSHIARTTTMAVSWRTKGIYYAKNEFFLDVVESVQYLMNFKDKVIRRNLIHGQIKCKSYLSGMPTLRIALNKILQDDKQFLGHAKFHQCVSLNSINIKDLEKDLEGPNDISNKNFVNKKEIEFIPPDGEFVLCQYELRRHVKDPPVINMTSFDIKPNFKKFRVQISLKIETHFKRQNSTSLMTIKIPLLQLFNDYKIDLSKQPRFKSDVGKVLFNISEDFLIWEIDALKGGHGENEKGMVAEFFLFNQEEYDRLQEEAKISMNPPPLRNGPKLEELYEEMHENEDAEDTALKMKTQYVFMQFEIPYSTCSGLKVEYLKIEEDLLKYQSFPWVRYKTLNDDEYAFIV
ncbi:hypothetical protein TPHA_0I02390 [Tetrapisispora phaffii CBS 4417]|uniref:MHD domain-containing protein n=1 Tax=Tetrapisispora phaffii (strain ATCC 24235 / CBS 4417 / NBRC 1672 / NRRL Y-8282 / UCD 70-5) TaxID=1071381 RepID=G8BXW4_TETPH|nr:hypothetical protein TPHA_0I02390 [Tetrapisispora phaffii CBS 4417]CCE64742.1 hypothetical protein TPHA_0I02390 [Tetrapisispora phaffii CBS 4417]